MQPGVPIVRSFDDGFADSPSFGDWLRTQLKARRMSQRLLAERSGVDHSTISRIIVGTRSPRLDTANKLTRHLGDTAECDHVSIGSALPGTHPIARVEQALRADDLLSDSQVRQVMECYLALRSRRLRAESDAPMLRAVHTVKGRR